MQETGEFETIEIDGEIFSVMSNGRMFPTISGGATDDDGDDDHEDDNDDDDDSEDGDDGSDGDDDGDEEEGDKPKMLSEDEVRRIASKEKKDGRRAGRNAVLQELGVTSVGEALRKMSGGKPKGGSSDEDQDQQVLEQEMQDERAMSRVQGKAERALIRQGVPDSPKALRAALSALELEKDFSDDDITTAVEDLKEEFPALFGTETKERRKPPASDAGRGKRRREQPNKNAADDLMARRHGTK